MRAAKGGRGKGGHGGGGTEDPGWVDKEDDRRGGLESKTLGLGRRKGNSKGKGEKGKGKGGEVQGTNRTKELKRNA